MGATSTLQSVASSVYPGLDRVALHAIVAVLQGMGVLVGVLGAVMVVIVLDWVSGLGIANDSTYRIG